MTAPLLLGMGDPVDQPGGLNRHLVALHAALRRAGLPATALVVAPPGPAAAGLTRVSARTAPLPVRVVAAALAGRRLAPATGVVDAHFALYAWWPATRGALRRHPLVVHVQGDWGAESATNRVGSAAAHRAKEWLQRDLTRRASAVVVLSEAVAVEVVGAGWAHPRRVHVQPPGVAPFPPWPERAAARTALGLPAGTPVVLTVRRLVARTGVDVAIRAVASLDGVVLAVVGDGPERAGLAALAASLGVGDRVRLVGRVADADLPGWYRAADLTVVPSVAHEGWGLVVDESLAAGTPVVASRTGGLPDAVARAGGDDVLVPPGDPAALAERLAAALDGSRPLPPPEQCRAAVADRPWSAVAARTAALYARAARPRVVVLDHCARPSGAQLALAVLAPHLAEELDLTVVLGEEGPVADRLRASGVVVEVLPLTGAAGLGRRSDPLSVAAAASTTAYALRLARLLRHRRADLLHANTLRAGLLAGPAARLTGVPLVWSARDRLTPDYLSPRTARLVRAVAESCAAAVVANSPATLLTWAPRRPLGRVVPSPGTVPAGVPRHPGEPFTVGTLSRLAPWKGQDLVVEAFAAAFPDGPQRLRVAGAAWFGEDDGPGDGWSGAVRATADRLGVGDRVDVVGHRDAVDELARVDVVCAYSRVPEPFGQVVVEALVAGRPVVAGDEGGPATTLTDGVDGLLVPPRDPGALAGALRRLHDDAGLRSRLAAAGTGTAQRYRPERLAAELLAVHREVLATRTAARR